MSEFDLSTYFFIGASEIIIVAILEILSIVFSLLFMHYSAKYRNKKLSVGWYICGVLFGLLTVVVFLIRRQDFPSPDSKICHQCGGSYPESFQVCPTCNIELPQINTDEKQKQKKRSRGFGTALIITYILSMAVGIVSGAVAAYNYFNVSDIYDCDYRISVNGVFYDKMGNSYEDEDSVLFYDEDGHVYTYTVTEDDMSAYSQNYVRDDGKKYYIYDCYVTEDGWFYCDKAMELETYCIDTSTMTEEELDEYYEDYLNYLDSDEEYKYYNYPYVDKKGNFYYCAYEASWNENGELITAENDVS